ncbi:hypothetical protein ZIOFF_057768 [Zingiber officinale]|uniref:Uncharacterized protein n=1 Tax=Zingiber officinale TaxID=94328 RepID=A0A8J5KLB3_ZINOF|nr:hypothetical protein ZIOFF_057768 [Zingiber officinale]
MYIGYFNTFSSGVPPEFGRLSSLVRLDMGGCNLTGTIPASLGQLKNLDTLFLHINNLTSTIPLELVGLTQLKQLDLSINELIGEIPASRARSAPTVGKQLHHVPPRDIGPECQALELGCGLEPDHRDDSAGSLL